LTISELARELELNKGTTRDLLETLRAHGLLERDAERKQYRLGPQLARLGIAALGQLDLAGVAHPFLVDLAAETGGAALLLVRQADRARIVDKVDAGHVAVEVSATVGRRIPLAAGACGKVFLAHVPDEERTTYLERLGRATPRTIREPSQYSRELARVKDHGYATDDEEYLPGVRATSAPIFDARQQLVGALLVVGLTSSLSAEDLVPTGQATARAARAISAALGAG
jgi:DNA-binding IclR family transcriptional regulator